VRSRRRRGGTAISSVVFRMSNIGSTRDITGVDDLRYVFAPESASIAFLSLAPAALLRRRRGGG